MSDPNRPDIDRADIEMDLDDQWPSEFSNHVLLRTVVLEELKLLYVPVPKAACTSLLWWMAELAQLPKDRFAWSRRLHVAPTQAVHDARMWQHGQRLLDYRGAERERVLTEKGWFRFTAVREPASRLWSAWQSKLLVRDPRFVGRFGDQTWLPRYPETPDQIVEDFRAFVEALEQHAGEDSIRDVHWGLQHDLIQAFDLDHVGRVERLDETLAALQAHLGGEAANLSVRQTANRNLLPYHPAVYDEQAAATVAKLFAVDYERYGYEPISAPEGGSLDSWSARVEPLIPAVQEMISRHQRLSDLGQVLYAQQRQVRQTMRRYERAQHRIEQQRERIERNQERLRQRREELQRVRQQAEGRAERLEKRIETLTSQRNELRTRLEHTYSSVSWQITRPLRGVAFVARRAHAAFRWVLRR